MRPILSLFLCLCWLSFSYAQKPSALDSLVRSGYSKLEKQDYDGAMRDFDRVLTSDPSHIQARGGKISANISSSRFREAQRLLDQSLREFPSEAEFVFWRGMLQNARRQYQKAIVDFDQALGLNPEGNLSRIYLGKANSLNSLGKTEEAIEQLHLAVSSNPQSINAYNARGLILYRNENYQDALKDFTRITEIDPQNDVAFYNKAMSYFRMNDSQNACIFFHKACELGNRNACQMIIMECQ
jgi:tetratricopeptide (TPR) repeat protein